MVVVIVGGGISGITAASELTKEGVKVILLEAQDRIGGRINTINSGRRNYDLGASWMHETLTNPLFKVANSLGLRMTYDDGATNIYTRKGLVDPQERVAACANDIFHLANIDYMQGKYRREDTTIQKYAAEFVKNWPLITPIQKTLAPRYAQLIELWAAESWSQLPASQASLDFMGRNAFMVDGYADILEWVHNQVVQSNFELHLSEPVTRISKESGQYIIKTNQKEYIASDVICSIPVGPLKSELFDFELPPPLIRAIEEGEMGSLGKFFLEFEHKFWPDDIDRFSFLVDEDPMAELAMKPGNFPLMAASTYNQFGGPHTLFFLSAPPLTQFLEANPDKIFEHLEPFLEAIKLPGHEVCEPSKVYHSSWSQNPFFQGTYSVSKFGQDYERGIQPFIDGCDRLRFAGEHTAFEGQGCVHGAYLSGQREAGNVLDSLNTQAEDQ